jgi:large subunit ribosomal protein L9
MQVIIFKNIDGLGMQGDVVNVKPGHFRNYLNPYGMAVEATATNLKRLEAKRNKLRAEAEKQRQAARAYADRLAEAQVKFVLKSPDGTKLFGSVHSHEIVEQLVAQGFEIEKRQILGEPLKTVGEHKVRVRLSGGVDAQVTVVVEAEPLPQIERPARIVADEDEIPAVAEAAEGGEAEAVAAEAGEEA